ncbi:Protein CHLOROPLAST J-LIKE DOMAIN 1 [Ranunculus cassubicifolius]
MCCTCMLAMHGLPCPHTGVRVRDSQGGVWATPCTGTHLNFISSAGSSSPDSDINPYEVLGVNPLESFDKIKTAYSRKSKDAERRGDEATLNRLEKAYDKVMMAQLSNRKKGLTFGSFQVSKDIKYADKQPIVPWGPRFTKSSADDTRINMAISTVWNPLQFLAFVFVYRIFEKLKSFEPQVSSTFNEEGEDEGRGLLMGKRLLRSLCLVFGSIAIASVQFSIRAPTHLPTSKENLIQYFLMKILHPPPLPLTLYYLCRTTTLIWILSTSRTTQNDWA